MPKPSHKFLKSHDEVRIVGGELGGRKLKYAGDPQTRPMKDRTREAVFNLIGTELKGKHAVDLFGGTGAMAIEAVSRGASGATIIEKHFPMARAIRENVQRLGIEDRVELVTGDTFAWFKRRPTLPPLSWAVFCCPPYALYDEQRESLLALLEWLIKAARPDSVVVVEYDSRFQAEQLPHPQDWDIRHYRPAIVGVYRTP